MIEVLNILKIYEKEGKECLSEGEVLKVVNHWNQQDLVMLQYKDINITVSGSDLTQAIFNARNVNRY